MTSTFVGQHKEGSKQIGIVAGKGDEGNSSRGISPFNEKS